ncbi:DUF2834 domain-containing protein [Nodularia sp. UHCC 0506]|uniref:DUF2834 domain-containing protein n=1 Tax=Nodularia sp. UHCC 0506 TaxID=3110243 RepID=UPI002B209F33|nr:DUF2834 domain-containing protein [Nodularia sp. UHCC 0506]MEA5512675.1 DUF2834 domain-containing protein [Nodularia sp. UHCC 0506]
MQNITYVQPASRKIFTAKSLYLLLAIIGTIDPWIFLFQFFSQNGLAVNLFFQSAFANYISSELTADLLISALVFCCFALWELKRIGVSQRRLFFYVVITFGIGLSCALPLFLYFREQALEIPKLNQ